MYHRGGKKTEKKVFGAPYAAKETGPRLHLAERETNEKPRPQHHSKLKSDTMINFFLSSSIFPDEN